MSTEFEMPGNSETDLSNTDIGYEYDLSDTTGTFISSGMNELDLILKASKDATWIDTYEKYIEPKIKKNLPPASKVEEGKFISKPSFGHVYYSHSTPHMEGDIPAGEYDSELKDRINMTLHNKNIGPKEIKSIQLALIDVGYLDPYYATKSGAVHHSADGVMGAKTKGAMLRYRANRPTTQDKIIDFMKGL